MKRCMLCLMALVLAAQADLSYAFNIFTPDDFIIAIDTDFLAPVSSTPASGNEDAPMAIDGDINTKYLNFGKFNTGILVTPGDLSTVQSMVLSTANDAVGRTPASYILQGTNVSPTATPNNGTGEEIDYMWETISEGTLALPDTFLTVADPVNFTNSSSYSSYRLYFPTIKDSNQNSMQIAEIQFYSGLDGTGNAILSPTDPIVAIADDELLPQSASPAAELPEKAIDRILTTKYLNFAEENSGFILTPSVGATIVNSFNITTANDWPERDPTSYEIWGTNEEITTPNNGIGNEQNYTLITSGTLEPPIDRFTQSPTIEFSNNTAYTSYKVVFPTVRDAATANSMQIAEFSLNAADVSALVINISGPNAGTGFIRADESFSIGSYEIRSASGLLASEEWTSITSTGADASDNWSESSRTDFLIAEADGEGGADNGLALSAGGQFNLGEAFRVVPSFYADGTTPTNWNDAIFILYDENGTVIGGNVEFVGDPVPWGDFNGDLSIDAADWPAFRAGMGGDFTGMSELEAYLLGDLDGDLDNDIDDFNLFVSLVPGGMDALIAAGVQVPEPSSIALFAIAGAVAFGVRRRRHIAAMVAMLGFLAVPALSQAQSMQNFSVVGSTPTTSIPADQANENETSGPDNFFDDTILDDPGQVVFDLFSTDYNDPELFPTGPPAQYAGLGVEPKVVFLDYGSSVTANWFMYAQRSGAITTADRVGMFEFWFSNTDFGGVLPSSDPDSVVELLPDDSRIVDSTLRPYTLGGDQSGRYVAMRLTVSEISGGVGNIGGHEFRLLDGPSDVVLDVNRTTGEMTIRNNLAGSENIFMKAYSIDSPGGGLDADEFNGLAGIGAFTAGNGSGNGWESGDMSNDSRLMEAYYLGETTLSAGTAAMSIGAAYNEVLATEDLIFKWTNSQGEVYNGRVVYSGAIAPLAGDYNGDDIVDLADYTVWRDNLGSTTANLPNDNTPSIVDMSDYDTWKENFGISRVVPAGLSTAAVPEPATLGLCLLAAAGLAVYRRR
ncbi:PEP-CTERM sorting domain-containing protein [Aeoliella mucimassa]|uniref:PEP-CTERM motif protein n=1 Tax=Aeoliella mucimassa TaxID=2527972 RepID=A0A518AVH8_9BACT|nr:PEP-CTERM sorting domain-containing protein [Aeoliella mucimassa]QDU58712.1 PEP-CTERM motif protein [Aeoliella mucimassa]